MAGPGPVLFKVPLSRDRRDSPRNWHRTKRDDAVSPMWRHLGCAWVAVDGDAPMSACQPGRHNWKPTEIADGEMITVTLVCLRCAHTTSVTERARVQ